MMGSTPRGNDVPNGRHSPVRFGVFSPSAPSEPPQRPGSPWTGGTTRGQKRRASFDEDSDSDFEMEAKRVRGQASAAEELDLQSRLAGLSTQTPTGTGFHGPQATIPLERLLSNLDREGLLLLVGKLVELHPGLADSLATLVPRPTANAACQQLQSLTEKLEAAFPYTKWGPDRGDYSFNRVRPQLQDLLDRTAEYLAYFVDPRNHPEHEYAGASMSFLHFVVQLCGRLPEWQNPQRTAETRDVLLSRALSAYLATIRELGRRARDEGKVYAAMQLKQWTTELQALQQRFNGFPGVRETLETFQRELGWLLGMTGVNVGNAEPSSSLPPALAAILGEGFNSHPVLQSQPGQGVVGAGWGKRN